MLILIIINFKNYFYFSNWWMQMFSSILRGIFELWHLYTNVVFSCFLLSLVSIFSIIFRVYNNSHSSHVWLFATQWTVACQALLSMGFSRQEWLELVSLPFSRGIFPTQESNLGLPHCRQIVYHLNHQGNTITEVYLVFFFFFLFLPSMFQFLDFISREIFLRIPEIVSVSLISTSIFLELLL